MPKGKYTSEAGGPKVLWIIATADHAVTVDELDELLDTSRTNIAQQVRRLYRSEFLLRRERNPDGHGKSAYEYRLNPREEKQ